MDPTTDEIRPQYHARHKCGEKEDPQSEKSGSCALRRHLPFVKRMNTPDG